jgi:hypothetical protein
LLVGQCQLPMPDCAGCRDGAAASAWAISWAVAIVPPATNLG